MMKKKTVTLNDLALMIGRGFAAVDKCLDAMGKRFDAIEKRLGAIEKRLSLLEQRVARI
jgi:hypothetical protein